MRAFLILPLLALPALAQEPDPAPPGDETLIERGLRQMLEGLMREMEPALRDLESLAEDAQPLLEGLGRFDPSLYHPPEILENGDILIRRRDPDAIEVEPNPDGSIDL
jgi:hypothetical protein